MRARARVFDFEVIVFDFEVIVFDLEVPIKKSKEIRRETGNVIHFEVTRIYLYAVPVMPPCSSVLFFSFAISYIHAFFNFFKVLAAVQLRTPRRILTALSVRLQ